MKSNGTNKVKHSRTKQTSKKDKGNRVKKLLFAERIAKFICRIVFFAIVCMVLLAVPSASVAAIIIVAQKSESTLADLGVVLTGLIGIVGSIFSSFRIVVKYLFPPYADQAELKYLLQTNDADVQENRLYYKDNE